MILSLFACLIAMLPTDPPVVQTGDLTPLDGAVWEGEIRFQIDGSLYSQYLANRRVGDSDLPGYMKEKGELKLQYTMLIRFQVDALGEFSVVGADRLNAARSLRREFRYRFKEDHQVKGGINMDRTVQVAEVTTERVMFEGTSDYNRDNLPGGLRFLPSGKLDNKGSLKVSGTLTFGFQAKGEMIKGRSRQPASEADPNVRKRSTVTRAFQIPLTFEFDVNLRKEAVSGQISVSTAFTNPFSSDDAHHQKRAVFTDRSKVIGSYRMTPLFSDR